MYLTKECAAVAKWMERKAKEKIEEDRKWARKGRELKSLAFLYDPADKAASSYVRQKTKACGRVGIRSVSVPFAQYSNLASLDALAYMDGIIVQEPYPAMLQNQVVRDIVACHMRPDQDVDGLYYAQSRYVPATALGIYFLLRYLFGDSLAGRRASVFGRSKAVGWPIAEMLCRQLDMEVNVIHSKSSAERAREALKSELVVSCIGKPGIIQKEWNVQSRGTYIDVGFGRDENGKPAGDVEPELAEDIYKNRVTPVPGGVGPLTVAALMLNTAYGYSPTDIWQDMRSDLGGSDL